MSSDTPIISSGAPIQMVPVDELAELTADPRTAGLMAEILRLGRISRVYRPAPAPRLGDFATAEEFLAAHNGPSETESRQPARTGPLALTAGAGAPGEAADLPRTTDETERTTPR